jgi:chemotaxis methyl-accepting protein methylase
VPKVPALLRSGARGARKTLRIVWNVVTLSETARRYPDRAHELLWRWFGARSGRGKLINTYGKYLHSRHRVRQTRRPDSEHTFFLRNTVQFEVLRDLVRDWPASEPLRIASIGCSTGAELYSAIWTALTTRSDLDLVATGLDVSESAVGTARSARYSRAGRELQRLTSARVQELIDGGLLVDENDTLTVPEWLRERATWVWGSVFDTALAQRLGRHDIVFVNNVLCHFHDPQAAAALENIAEVVDAGGYLFLSGVDPDVKTGVVRKLGLTPVLDRVEDLYHGDDRALTRWPMTYWGPEPFDRRHPDWKLRYATLFRRRAAGEQRT